MTREEPQTAEGKRTPPTTVALYLVYLVVTSTVIFAIGFVTAGLGALVMALALGLFGAHAVAASLGHRKDDPPTSPARGGSFELVHRPALWATLLTCLPALFIPAELTSPMASAVFFLLFAVPTYVVVLVYRAGPRGPSRRVSPGTPPGTPTFGATLPAPGWYEDPVDARFVRWWDGERWTLHATPHP